MDDLSKLSKDELLVLLKQKESEETAQCIYKPIRGAQKECTSKAVTPYGFCKRHSQTTQARIKKREMNTANAKKKAEEEVKKQAEEEAQKKAEEETQKKAEEESKHQIEEEAQKKAEEPEDPEHNETPLVEEPVEEVIEEIKKELPKSKTSPKRVTRRIRPNAWGRFEDAKTHICFDPKTTVAYGVQEKDGSCRALGEKDIRICRKNNWEYLDVESDSDVSDESLSESEASYEELTDSDEDSDQNSDSETDDSDGNMEDDIERDSDGSEESQSESESSDEDDYSDSGDEDDYEEYYY